MQWITADGNSMEVSEMTTSHIQNALRMVEKRVAQMPDYDYAGLSDPAFGEDGIIIGSMINDDLEKEEIKEWIKIFQEELKTRIK